MTNLEVENETNSESGLYGRIQVEAVQQVLAAKKIAEVARELGVVEQTLHDWVKAYRAGKLGSGSGKPVTPEQMENSVFAPSWLGQRQDLHVAAQAPLFGEGARQ